MIEDQRMARNSEEPPKSGPAGHLDIVVELGG